MTHVAKESTIRIAAAQSVSAPGDIAANVQTHCRFIAAAHQARVDVLVFPELSLSGYELPLLDDCVLQASDQRLAPLRAMLTTSRMTVVVGVPFQLAGNAAPCIASLTLYPDGTSSVYCKQHLHPSEAQFAAAGTQSCPPQAWGDESFALAICADTSHAQHAENAAAAGASLYLASVLISEAGYLTDASKMQHYAQQFNMGTLIANHGAPSGAYVSAGKSAFWAPGGQLVTAAPGPGSFLVIAEKNAGHWRGSVRVVNA